jgi:hypothetical protein
MQLMCASRTHMAGQQEFCPVTCLQANRNQDEAALRMLTLRQQLLEQRLQRRHATDDILVNHEQRPGNDDETSPIVTFCYEAVLELIEAALLTCSHRPRPEDVRR